MQSPQHTPQVQTQQSTGNTTEVSSLRFSINDFIRLAGFVLGLSVAVMAIKDDISAIRTEFVAMQGRTSAQDQQIAELKARLQQQERRLNTEVPQLINQSLGELKTDIRWIIQRLSAEDKQQ